MQVGCQIWVNETDLLKVAESTLKLWRNWLGLRLALSISGVEDPSRLILAISTSSTVMGWVWNLAAVAALCLRSRCRPLPLDHISLGLELDAASHSVVVEARVEVTARTGVEMEALTAASVALLTVYDMCKAVTKDMVITDIRLQMKTGGKSDYVAAQ